MPQTLKKKWMDVVAKKNSLLCVGLDPAEQGQRSKVALPQGASKKDWCLQFIEQVAPYAAAIKINRNYIKDLSRKDVQELTTSIHAHGMLALDDSKIADIGDTNDVALYHATQEGFDAVTYAPFPGNFKETAEYAKRHHIGLIALVLMSNPEFTIIKNAIVGGMKGFEYFATQVKTYNIDGMVIGAPSEKNGILESDILRIGELAGKDRLVLMPGVGAQGGDAKVMIKIFGSLVMANVGRAIMGAQDPAREAKKHQDLLNSLCG